MARKGQKQGTMEFFFTKVAVQRECEWPGTEANGLELK